MQEDDPIETRPAEQRHRGWLVAVGMLAAGVVGGIVGASLVGRAPGGAVRAVPSIVQVVRSQRQTSNLADVIDARCPAIVAVLAGSSSDAGQDDTPLAMGVIISADGQVLTAARALPKDGTLSVVLGDGRRFDAVPGRIDDISGLALLKVDGSDLPALEFGQWAASRAGSLGALVSAPKGAGCTLIPAMIGSDFLAEGGGQRATIRLQPQPADVLPGTPFLAEDGSVAGIAALDPDDDDVLPGATAVQIASGLTRGDAGPTAPLGFEAEDVAPNLATRLGDGRLRGAMVDLIAHGSPANKAGLMAGDIIVEVNGAPVSNASELSRAIAGATGPVQLQVQRNGQPLPLAIKPPAGAGLKGRE